MVSFLQINLHRSRVADDLLNQYVKEKAIDVVLISEQYQGKKGVKWFEDQTKTAAIWIVNPKNLGVQKWGSGQGHQINPLSNTETQ